MSSGWKMEKIWLKHYEHLPVEINVDEYESIVAIFEESCKQFGNLSAYENFGCVISYTKVEERSRHFASYLQNALQLKKGDRVAVMMPNILQYPIAIYGILRAGLIVVNINPLYTVDELTFQLKDSGAQTIIVSENAAFTVASSLPNTAVKNVIVTKFGDQLSFPKSLIINFVIKYLKKMVPSYSMPNAISFKQAITIGSQKPFSAVSLTLQDCAFLQYTGGTTGIAKGAILLHKNIVANILQVDAILKTKMVIGKEIAILPLPFYHIYALLCSMSLFKYGTKAVLITNPRDIPGFIQTLKKMPFTMILGINTLFNALMNNSHFVEVDFSTLKIAIAGGMATQSKVAQRWQELTDTTLIEGYGLTETSPVVSFNPLNTNKFNGSVGIPVSSTEVKLLDDDNNEVGLNTPGELCVRGPQVMKGYWNQPEETAKVLSSDGWLRTGDIATIDENGFITIVDRKKDMIDISGFKVYPNQIEDVIAKHPGVLEVGVTGYKTSEGDEHVKAFIIKKDPKLTQQDILNYCKEHLTKYKIPKKVEFVNELPKSTVGKILRRKLITK